MYQNMHEVERMLFRFVWDEEETETPRISQMRLHLMEFDMKRVIANWKTYEELVPQHFKSVYARFSMQVIRKHCPRTGQNSFFA